MRENQTSTDFAMISGAVIACFTALLFLLGLPVVYADNPQVADRLDHNVRHFMASLNPESRRELKASVRRSVTRSNSRDNAAAIPSYQIYHSIFLEILMNPLLSASLPAADLQSIRSLPSLNDQRFVKLAQDAMARACKFVSKQKTVSPARVNVAVNALRQARNRVERKLNGHYREAVDNLSDTGRELVAVEYERLIDQDSLIHTELDLDVLGFNQPEFVMAFLLDSCKNAERVYPQLATRQRTLQNQLEDDNDRGAVQYFQSH